MKRFVHIAVLLLILPITWTASTPTLASSKADFDITALFKSNCAPCHGLSGKGGGPVATALRKQPPPLTTIAKRRGGIFPRDHVYRIIDGRQQIKAHGSRTMPIWGTYFGERYKGGSKEAREISIKFMIEGLVKYIESIQVK